MLNVNSPNDTDVGSQSIPAVKAGTEILGIPIGSPAYVRSRCVDIAKSGQSLCSKVIELDDPQSSLLLLHHCFVSRLTHLTRSVCPDDLQSAACIHDCISRSTFSQIMHGYARTE